LNKQKLNVAAYCRVSTDHADQLNSLTSQIKYFTDYISSNADWQLKEVYYDEGITGTSVKKREAFNRMISDSESGKIDLILTKEVSRFARNTVDTLSFTRRLSAINVGVIFTNDNIDTRDKDGELRLTIMASIAQEESRKTSERVKWGKRRKMESGYVMGNHKMLGYRITNGVLEIEPTEAELVKRIFNMYLYEKMGLQAIANVLNSENIPTIKGNAWLGGAVNQTLTNCKYVGDLTQGRSVTTNYLTGEKKLTNENLIFIPNHHEGIISRELWDEVQTEIKRRGTLCKEGRKHSSKNWFVGKVTCEKCGSALATVTPRIGKEHMRSLHCKNRLHNTKVISTAVNGKQLGCDSRAINEIALTQFVRFVLEHIQVSRKEIVNDMLDEIKIMQQSDEIVDVKPLESEIENNIRKKRKAYDLMLDDKLPQQDLMEQSAFYDSEIARLTEEINQAQNLSGVHQMQIDKVKAHISEVNKAADIDCDTVENTDVCRELLDRFIKGDGYAIVYLTCMPIGFKIFYHTVRQNAKRKFGIIIDNYEIVE
jgi:DNA invertase Pin-like site-specific DNA recombinase